ncbi:MAG: hypothetical protein V3U87_09225 [Methylococcaceae bacterium]
MELVEEKYRDTVRGNKKYAKRLTEFVSSLLNTDRVLEAGFYFKELEDISPDHFKTVVLGYKLSIRIFDSKGVSCYDEKLINLKRNEEQLLLLRLQYYYSVNNQSSAEDCALSLLSKKHLESETLQAISDFIRNHSSYNLISDLGKYLTLNQMIFHPSIEKQFKNIVISKLIDCLQKAKH